VVSRGFDLIVTASGEIRRASVFVGLLLVLVVGPAAVLAMAVLASAPADLETLAADLEAFSEALDAGATIDASDSAWLSVMLLLTFLGCGALVGIIAVAVEAQIMAVAILGGRLAGRPLRVKEAIQRGRQTFWRILRASILVAIPVTITQAAVGEALSSARVPEEGTALLSGFAGAFVGSPFGYVPAAIVLGDVGAREALARSVNLARARWRLALVVALFPAVFGSVQVFALGAGGDILVRVAEALDLGFQSGAVRALITVALILVAIAALGSLVFTMSAVLTAPQVVAFVGLTHFVGGLDAARFPVQEPPAAQASPAVTGIGSTGWTVNRPPERFRWLSRPMLAGVAAMAGLAIMGVFMVAGLPAS
jgi:hypothetical protein